MRIVGREPMSTGQQLRWREPWWFALRMRDRRGWQRKGWLIIAVFVAMMLGWYLDQRYGKGLRLALTGAILMCLGIAVFVGFLSDLGLSEIQAKPSQEPFFLKPWKDE